MPPVSARNAAKSPRDLTGRKLKEQQDERAKQRALEGLPLEERLNNEYQRGFDIGSRVGRDSFIAALVTLYQSEGITAIEEFLQEEVAA